MIRPSDPRDIAPLTRVVHCTIAPSPRLLRACALFGIGVTRRPVDRSRILRRARRLISTLGPGAIAVIAGPSGCGKSTLLRLAARELRSAGHAPLTLTARPLPTRSIIDLFPGGIDRALRNLAAAGLADAALLPRTPAELSEGERFRLRLALAFAHSPRWLLIDEFAATLDRPAAITLCHLLRRFAARSNARIIIATPHEHIAAEFSTPHPQPQ